MAYSCNSASGDYSKLVKEHLQEIFKRSASGISVAELKEIDIRFKRGGYIDFKTSYKEVYVAFKSLVSTKVIKNRKVRGGVFKYFLAEDEAEALEEDVGVKKNGNDVSENQSGKGFIKSFMSICVFVYFFHIFFSCHRWKLCYCRHGGGSNSV